MWSFVSLCAKSSSNIPRFFLSLVSVILPTPADNKDFISVSFDRHLEVVSIKDVRFLTFSDGDRALVGGEVCVG